MKHENIDKQIVRNFILGEIYKQEDIIEKVPVFGRRYEKACDQIEELEAVLEAADGEVK